MKHTAWIITAEDVSAARIVTPILLPALREAAVACCDEVEIRADCEGEMPADTVVLMLDASMPLITEADMRLLLDAVEDGAGEAHAEGTSSYLPRCVSASGGPIVNVPLLELNLFRVEDNADAAQALSVLRGRKNDALMRNGVVLIDPMHTYIDFDVRIGVGTVIHPNCTISGGSIIGSGCTMLPGCRIAASTIADGATVDQSTVLNSVVGEGTTVGPYATLRSGTQVGSRCRIGNFIELKNSRIGDDTMIAHHAYVGDVDVGSRVNIGCGVVFVNYDGRVKHRSTVEDDAFIGCNVNLVAPVHIGEGAFIAAGSTVTEDVPPGALAIARARQANKEGWVARRGEPDA